MHIREQENEKMFSVDSKWFTNVSVFEIWYSYSVRVHVHVHVYLHTCYIPNKTKHF